jgi:hypothetical protein
MATQENSATEEPRQTEEVVDSPLLDSLGSNVKRMIARAHEPG